MTEHEQTSLWDVYYLELWRAPVRVRAATATQAVQMVPGANHAVHAPRGHRPATVASPANSLKTMERCTLCRRIVADWWRGTTRAGMAPCPEQQVDDETNSRGFAFHASQLGSRVEGER